MHKPTLLKVLRILKDIAPGDPQTTRALVEHVVTRCVAQDPALDASKLLAGAGIQP